MPDTTAAVFGTPIYFYSRTMPNRLLCPACLDDIPEDQDIDLVEVYDTEDPRWNYLKRCDHAPV